MYQWRKDIAQWTIKDTLYLSVVFTWDLPRAKDIAAASKKKVIAGGPAVSLMPDYLRDVAEIGKNSPFALAMHNPLATFTTRGCTNKCSFCAVPKTEGDLIEWREWRASPVVCDNNLLAASQGHFDMVIDSLKHLPFVDFNQGLQASLFTDHHAQRMSELKAAKVRFSFDHISNESAVVDAINRARVHGLNNLGVYVMIGFEEAPEDAIYRLELIRSMGIWPNPMRYQPLTTLKKNEFLPPQWDETLLLKVMKYYSRLRFVEHIPFDEYEYTVENKQEAMFL